MSGSTYTIEWDKQGERLYETGVDGVVLYPIPETLPQTGTPYNKGVAWNGVMSISQSASGGEPSPLWADNIKYLNLVSAEEATLSIEAYTYPEEFEECDGSRAIVTGSNSEHIAIIGQQSRKMFGLCYRTLIGNDIKQTDLGYKLHLVYGCLASPSDRSYATVNDSPEAISFSWSVTTTPVEVPSFKPTSIITVDSTKAAAAKLSALEELLYGNGTLDAKLPLPSEVISTLS